MSLVPKGPLVTPPIGRVLSLCDYSGVMVEPWLELGYECWIVDTQHPAGIHRHGRLVRVGEDINTWLPPRLPFDVVFAFPPCTHLAQSGARWFRSKGLGALIEALTLVERCRLICEWSGAPYMIENPVGQLSTYWRKPDFYFDPNEYAGWLDDPDSEAYTKRTCVWSGGGFVQPEPKPVPVLDIKNPIHHAPPGPERANFRSRTPAGFARAVFQANHGH